MIIFDAHCDTISELLNRNKSLKENDMHIDAKRLSAYESYTQVFAAFIDPEYKDCAMERAKAIIAKFYDEMQENGITVCKNFTDRQNAKTPVKAFLSLEGGEPIESISDLHELYDLGVRMIAPTWNFKNKIACGVCEEQDTGLTEFGKSVIAEMNRLGIILDVSHLSPKSFYDAAEISEKPLCASHSCAKALNGHKRNLTDEQFSIIKKSGGVVGVNFYPLFAGDDISDIVHHIDYFISLGGEDNIGLGSDFDGVECLPTGLNGVQDMEKLIKMLPYSTEIREKIAYKNFIRLIEVHNC